MTRRWLTVVLMLVAAACGPTFRRASEDPEIDRAALSVRLDRVDLELALDGWIDGFESSPFVARVGALEERPTIAILSISNETSEHIGSALDNLLSSAETKLVQSGRWRVVDNTTLTGNAILAERVRSLGDDVDPETIAALGSELGIHYFINGRVGETAEKTSSTRRVQYFLYLRVTNVATREVEWQEQIDITKQIDD